MVANNIQNNPDNAVYQRQLSQSRAFSEFATQPVGFQTQAYVQQVPDQYVAEDAKKSGKKPNKFVNFISNVAKFFASVGEIAKGTIKGLFYGTLTGLTFAGGAWLFGSIPRGFKELSKIKGLGNKLKGLKSEAIKNTFKSISPKGKLIAGIAGASVLAFHFIKGILNKNKKNANIEHALNTGHKANS